MYKQKHMYFLRHLLQQNNKFGHHYCSQKYAECEQILKKNANKKLEM